MIFSMQNLYVCMHIWSKDRLICRMSFYCITLFSYAAEMVECLSSGTFSNYEFPQGLQKKTTYDYSHRVGLIKTNQSICSSVNIVSLSLCFALAVVIPDHKCTTSHISSQPSDPVLQQELPVVMKMDTVSCRKTGVSDCLHRCSIAWFSVENHHFQRSQSV